MRARLMLAGCAALISCTDVETGPNVATSLEFHALPFPAVVALDTLRDTTGLAAPVRAIVFNSDNEEIAGAPVRYASLDTTVRVDSLTGVVVGGAAPDTSARIIATIGAIQSAPLRLIVVSRPDSVARSGSIDTLRYSVTDTTKNLSGDLGVRVLHRPGIGTPLSVPGWVVTFALLNPADSARARLVGEDGRRSTTDTTSSGGVAARRIRLLPAGLTSARDSIVVLARVRYRGTQLAGSPVRLALPVQPLVP